jgi:phenylalanyl-tRNA synthetase beta chain
VGTRFTRAHGETRTVAVAWTGHAEAEHWSRTGRTVDLFDLFGVVTRVGQALGCRLHLEPATHGALCPGRSVRIIVERPDGSRIEVGWAGQLLPALADARGLPHHDDVLVAEIDLDLAAPDYASDRLMTMRPLPRHPSVVRDVSLLVRADLPAAIVRGTMQAAGPPTLVGVQEFDRYQGASLPDGHVSLSMRLTFRDQERTLTDAEVSAAVDAIVAAVQDQHGAMRR